MHAGEPSIRDDSFGAGRWNSEQAFAKSCITNDWSSVQRCAAPGNVGLAQMLRSRFSTRLEGALADGPAEHCRMALSGGQPHRGTDRAVGETAASPSAVARRTRNAGACAG